MPHEEARRAIQAADVVVDNLITGDYELVSIEAMASSRVAVANIQAPSAAAFPGAPVYSVDPDTVEARLRALLGDIGLRRELAARGRAHVAATHDAPVAAEKLLAAYRTPSRPVAQQAFPDAPVFNVDPETIEARLRTLVGDLELRRSLAARGRAHVATTHDASVAAARLLAAYEAPSRPVERQLFPAWVSLAPARRIEHLERLVAEARHRELDLRRKLGLPVEVPEVRTAKDRLPMPLRLFLRRWRARLTRAVKRRRGR